MSRITRCLLAVTAVALVLMNGAVMAAPARAVPAANAVQAVDLTAAVQQHLVVATIRSRAGASGPILEIHIQRVSATVLVVTVRPGQVFRNSQVTRQDVVAQKVVGELAAPGANSARVTSVMTLNDRATHYFIVQAFCLQFHKDNLGAGLPMSIAGVAPTGVVSVVRAIRSEAPIVAQDAIWAVTDNVSKKDVASRGYGLSATGIQQVRMLLSRAGLIPGRYKLTK